MIPRRIQLSGFLSYKAEQAVDFGSAALWMLAGANGSGKSSVFDAVTYALFGAHRGGGTNAGELINKDSSALAVEFDFQLAGELVRAKRTLKRDSKGKTAGTQQLFRQAGGKWEAVAGTGIKSGFDAWVREHIGLDYATFTSSVLLLQGQAEKLLNSAPKDRAEVLARIVDLERYKKLHERANDRKIALKNKLEALAHVQTATPEVTDLEYAEAILAMDARESDRDMAQEAADRAQAAEVQSQRWADTQTRLAGARAKLAAAEGLLTDAARIEQLAARLVELESVLPAVGTVLTMRGKKGESQAKTDAYQKQREEAQDKKKAADHAADQARKKRDGAAKELTAEEAALAAVNARLPAVAGLLEVVKHVDAHTAQLAQLTADRDKLDPAAAETASTAARAEADRLSGLATVLPHLEQFQTERHDLTAARRTYAEEEQKRKATEARGKDLKGQHEQAKAAAADARTAQSHAQSRVAVTTHAAAAARTLAADFASLDGQKQCRACGQPLTAAHFAAEKAKREKDAKQAEVARTTAAAVLAAAEETLAEAVKREAELAEQITRLRESYAQHKSAAQSADADANRLWKALDLRHAQLPAAYQAKVGEPADRDWAATTFPERDELIKLRREVNGLDAARERGRQAEAVLSRARSLDGKIETVRENLARSTDALGGADPQALRRESQELAQAGKAHADAIRAAKALVIQLDADFAKATAAGHDAVQSMSSLQNRLDLEAHHRQTFAADEQRALGHLPPAWQDQVRAAGLSDHSKWKTEADRLTQDRIADRHKQLVTARAGQALLRADIDHLEAEAEAYPADCRVDPAAAKAALAAARSAVSTAAAELSAAADKIRELDRHKAERVRLGAEYTTLSGEHKRYENLAELLGRNRLQRFLVRQAERQIVEYANAVLDRLSGGQLYLRLVGSDDGTDQALDLECANRVSGGSPINVTFLSGSQKFRVAVSLALAIGQYASRQHRPIESVIIDEGFGCLDRQGRQVMIQELQNLGGHLHCVLLVSHQEEFTDAFPNGYKFEMQDGATTVARFER